MKQDTSKRGVVPVGTVGLPPRPTPRVAMRCPACGLPLVAEWADGGGVAYRCHTVDCSVQAIRVALRSRIDRWPG